MFLSLPSLRADILPFVRLGLPLVGSAVAGFMIHMTDTLMLGWYDVTDLAAATLATSFRFVLFILGAGFGFAVMPIVAAAQAVGDEVRARRATRMAFWLSLGFFAVVMPALWWSGALFTALGQEPDVVAEAEKYLRIAGWGVAPALMTAVLRSYVSALHLTAVLLWSTLAAVVLNAGVNWLLIFGNWGAPELGIRGAAIASALIETLLMLTLAVYAHVKRPEVRLFQRIWRADPEALWQIFRLGLPIGLTSLAEVGLFTASTAMMGWLGTIALAAHGIALQLAALAFMFHVGMSQAATIRAGAAFGRKDEPELRRVALTASLVAGSFSAAVVLLFVVLPTLLVGLYIDPTEPAREELLRIGVILLSYAALFQFVDAGQVTALALLRGVQDTAVPAWLASFSYWAIGLPVGYLLAFPLGLGERGVWLGLTLGLAAAAGSLAVRFWGKAVRIGPA